MSQPDGQLATEDGRLVISGKGVTKPFVAGLIAAEMHKQGYTVQVRLYGQDRPQYRMAGKPEMPTLLIEVED